jgi:hypothetical protein
VVSIPVSRMAIVKPEPSKPPAEGRSGGVSSPVGAAVGALSASSTTLSTSSDEAASSASPAVPISSANRGTLRYWWSTRCGAVVSRFMMRVCTDAISACWRDSAAAPRRPSGTWVPPGNLTFTMTRALPSLVTRFCSSADTISNEREAALEERAATHKAAVTSTERKRDLMRGESLAEGIRGQRRTSKELGGGNH